jgi:hypothetical protein
MKKLKLFIAILLFAGIGITNVKAQSFGEGSSTVTVGYGFPNFVKSIMKAVVKDAFSSSNGAYSATNGSETVTIKTTGTGPLLAKYEYGLNKVIGVGGVIGYSNAKFAVTHQYTDYNYNTGSYGIYTDKAEVKYSSLSIGARMNFHFAVSDKLDPYAGIGAGYSSSQLTSTVSTDNPNGSKNAKVSLTGVPVYFALTIGMRGYITDNFGFYGELGIDKASVLQAGVAVKF